MGPESFQLVLRSQFWIFQFFGWSVWVVMLVLRDLFFVPPEYIFSRALVAALSAAVGMVLTSGLRYLYRLFWERGFVVRFLVTWFGSMFAAMMWQPFRNTFALLPFGEVFDVFDVGPEDLWDGVFSSSFPTLFLWSGLYFVIKYYQLFQAEKEKSLRSEALAHEAQLLMLRYQLNPHFLFNTLNAISTLVLSQATEKANEMVTKLSKFLRYSLDHSPLDRVSFAHELETSQLYLDIEKVRFGERLKLAIDIDAEVEHALVPTMLLQPIIENSIKHGISKAEQGGCIEISARKSENKLIIMVTDDGPGLSEEDLQDKSFSFSKGVGVSNIRNRLSEIYGDNQSLEFLNAQPNGLTVKVTIPYDRE